MREGFGAMAISSYGVQDRQLTPTERWVCFASLFLFGFTAAFNLFKVPPVLGMVAGDIGLSAGMTGMTMTAYSIACLILAWPGMLIMRKLGVKAAVVGSGVVMLLGSLIICVAGTTVAGFMVGRVIEGCAYGLICVIGPNIMPRLFPLKNQGLCMGIWSQWIPMGTILAGVIVPIVFNATGSWMTIWYVSVVIEVISLVWMAVSVKMPAIPENELVGSDPNKRIKPQKNFMLAGIMMSVAFTFWAYLYVCNINGLYPTYLQEVKGWDVGLAAMPTNLIALITIPVGIAVGVVADKLNCRKALVWIPYAVVAVMMATAAWTEDSSAAPVWVFAVVHGLCASCIPTCTRAIIPVLVPTPAKTDVALTTMAFVTGLAQVCATFASMSVAAIGWSANGLFVLCPLAAAAAIIVLVFAKNDRKVMELRAEEQAE